MWERYLGVHVDRSTMTSLSSVSLWTSMHPFGVHHNGVFKCHNLSTVQSKDLTSIGRQKRRQAA